MLAAAALLQSRAVTACSIRLPPLDEQAANIAVHGVLIQGTLTQAFDAKQRQPEIIRADKVFVGPAHQRAFRIYRRASDYDPSGAVRICPDPLYTGVGERFDRLVLVSATVVDKKARNEWVFSLESAVSSGQGLDLLNQRAALVGRFQAMPARNPDELWPHIVIMPPPPRPASAPIAAPIAVSNEQLQAARLMAANWSYRVNGSPATRDRIEAAALAAGWTVDRAGGDGRDPNALSIRTPISMDAAQAKRFARRLGRSRSITVSPAPYPYDDALKSILTRAPIAPM